MIAQATDSCAQGSIAWEYEKQIQGGIVVGVDGSRESIAALNTAAAAARLRRCPLHIVSVLPRTPARELNSETRTSSICAEDLRISRRLAEVNELLRSLEPARDWSCEVTVGRPARDLAAIAERRSADLIVIGRRRHGPMDRVLGSETPLQVMRMSSLPVLAVESEIENPRTIVAAVDFSSSSVRAAACALEMLKARGSGRLYLVFVEPPADLIANQFMLESETRFPGDVVVWFRRFTDSLGAHAGVFVEPVVLSGRTVAAVSEFAERVGADLIAAGSHSHGRFERFLLGSVSTGLVRDAGCPVLVVPPGS
jgi:nucleotide-binding universal stress UspA family protein